MFKYLGRVFAVLTLCLVPWAASAQTVAQGPGGTSAWKVNFGGSAQPVTQSGVWTVTQSGGWSISFTAPQHFICDSGCGSPPATADNTAFTFGTTNVSPIGYVVDDVATNSITENSYGAPRMTGQRIAYADISKSAANTTPFLFTGSGTAGSAASGVATVQGIASMTPLIGTGNKTNNNAAPGATNLGVLPCLANASAPTWTEGDQVLASCDLSGNLRMSVGNGSATDTDDRDIATGQANVALTAAILYGYDGTSNKAIRSTATSPAAGLSGEVVYPYAYTDGTHVVPTMDAVARPGFVEVTDGTHTLPTMDAAARPGFIEVTDGTHTLPTGDAMARAVFAKTLPIGDGTLKQGGTSAMTSTTSTQVVAAVASNNLYIGSCSVNNTHASVDTLVDLQDGSGGTVLWTFTAPHGYGGESHTFNPPLKVTTQGNALFAADETTGASVKIFCQGFASTTSY